jgi:hypothetical protein
MASLLVAGALWSVLRLLHLLTLLSELKSFSHCQVANVSDEWSLIAFPDASLIGGTSSYLLIKKPRVSVSKE